MSPPAQVVYIRPKMYSSIFFVYVFFNNCPFEKFSILGAMSVDVILCLAGCPLVQDPEPSGPETSYQKVYC